MTTWAQLLPVALVGTERHAGALPAWPGGIGRTLAQAQAGPTPVAAGVLRAAAVLAVCESAGVLGTAWPQPLPAPAPPETRPAWTAGPLLELLAWTLRDGPARLQHEAAHALMQAGWRLPPRLLPAALDAGRRSLALRQVLTVVIGSRGMWLAAQHGDWRWAAGAAGADADDETVWLEGTLEQRRDFLRRERGRDAAKARARLAALLPELPARERAEFVAQLVHTLDMADEPLLEALRADRSKEVRQATQALLLRLPEAAHPRRAMARLAPLLTRERALLRTRWVVDAPQAVPEAVQAEWKTDQIELARPKDDALGERAWCLYQLARQVPLPWWCSHTGMTAAELRDWAQAGDWADALLRAWREVLHAAPDAAWCEAFLERWPKAWPLHERGAVLAHVPPAARESHWQRELSQRDAWQGLAPQWLAACAPGQTLSRAFSQEVASRLRREIDAGALAKDWTLRQHLPDIVCVLHGDALPHLQNLARGGDESAGLIDTLHTLAQIVQTRLALPQLPHACSAHTP